MTARLPLHVTAEARNALRAAELLVELPAADANGALMAMLHGGSHPRVQLCVVEGLLQSGARGAQLASLVPAPVLELAQQRVERARRFRSIQPGRR